MGFPERTPFSELLQPELGQLRSYLPDMSAYPVRLDANEAPSCHDQSTVARLTAAVADTAWERYPDPTAWQLRAALAQRCGVRPEEVMVGVGSDELVALLLTALSQSRTPNAPPSVVTVTPTFVMYRMSARVRGWQVVEVPLDSDWDLSEQGLLRAVASARPNLLFIASPNNPTGNLMNRDRIQRIVAAAGDTVCVIDEAYVDYAPHTQLELRQRFPNLIFLRTLSKIGFASLRVGWLIGPEALVRELDKARQPYNLAALSQRLATLVVTELNPAITHVVSQVVSERERMARAITQIGGYAIGPSAANFLWVRTSRPASDIFEVLKQHGILVRYFGDAEQRMAQQLRITVGSRAENDSLIEVLSKAT
jgi:histidinol-phosphate aminotransferase